MTLWYQPSQQDICLLTVTFLRRRLDAVADIPDPGADEPHRRLAAHRMTSCVVGASTIIVGSFPTRKVYS